MMLALFVRFPVLARPAAWAAAFIGFVSTDLLTGNSVGKTPALTSANFVGITLGHRCLSLLTRAMNLPAAMPAARKGDSLGLAMIDVDHFKLYNDHYGHTAGDDALRMVAQALASAVHRASDVVARYGGEEFVLITERAADLAAVVERARGNMAPLRSRTLPLRPRAT